MPVELPSRVKQNLGSLKTILTELSEDFANLESNPDLGKSGLDFLLPFLLTGSEHGLSIHTDIWYVLLHCISLATFFYFFFDTYLLLGPK
jgi:hypothetical protein